jgi:HK97 family phage prohead protease
MKIQQKTQKLADCEIKIDGKSGQFSGYASVFNGVDSYGDTILPGAYAETLANYWPKMFVNHDSYDLPVGKWLDIKEDDTGLFVAGEFTRGMEDADNAYAALKHGTVDGLSIGYHLKSDDYEPQGGQPDSYGRIIKRVSRLVEISLVTFPADDGARISSVKSAVEQLETIRDFERFLRDAGGFKKGEAEIIIARCKSMFAGDQQHADIAKLTARINQLHSKLEV